MERSAEWNEGYELGYRDGENGLFADYEHALDGLIDDPWPTKVQARIEALYDLLRRYIEHVEEVDCYNFIDGYARRVSHVEFTDDEWADLVRLAGPRPQT